MDREMIYDSSRVINWPTKHHACTNMALWSLGTCGFLYLSPAKHFQLRKSCLAYQNPVQRLAANIGYYNELEPPTPFVVIGPRLSAVKRPWETKAFGCCILHGEAVLNAIVAKTVSVTRNRLYSNKKRRTFVRKIKCYYLKQYMRENTIQF